MASCKECIHFEMCEFSNSLEYTSVEILRADCEHFMAAADVVEVVRCKNCIRSKPQSRGRRDCVLVAGCVKDNDYCSDGIRKESKDDKIH